MTTDGSDKVALRIASLVTAINVIVACGFPSFMRFSYSPAALMAETAPKVSPNWTNGGAAYQTSRSWMIGFRPSGVISRRASVIGSLKRRRPALPGFR